MNILWVSHVIPYPPKAGFLLRSYNLLKELARYHTVDLAAFVQEGWLKTFYSDREQGIADCRRALGELCRSVQFFPIEALARPLGKERTALAALTSTESYSVRWLRSRAATDALAKLARTNRYDIAHFDTIGLAPYRQIFQGTPATLTHHNIESHMMLRRADNEKHPLKRAYFRLEGRKLVAAEKAAARDFACHITCSELDSERFREIAPEARMLVVPNGVDCDYFAPRAGAAGSKLVFIGTMNWYPNVDAMLFFLDEVWPGLRKVMPSVELDIIGANPPAQLAKKVEASPGVRLMGFVDDIRQNLAEAALVVCPIRDGGGTKLKLLDAFAMGKCVVAHPIACEGINVTDGKDIVLASQPEEFIARIGELLPAPERCARIGAAARELVEREYSYRSIGLTFARELESLGGQAERPLDQKRA